MGELDLTRILKDCPKGWKFYTSVWGEVEFIEYNRCGDFIFDPIDMGNIDEVHINTDGTYCCFGECIIFPSKEQRDWSKFTAPWYKKEKFDPKTLEPFDKVLIKSYDDIIWRATLFSHIVEIHDDITRKDYIECVTSYCVSTYCVPYNDETKHLLGTEDEAPKYYRYWEE